MRISRLEGAPFGAQVTGADLSALDDAGFAEILAALAAEGVVVFRGQQDLTPRDQIAFSARFGVILPPQLQQFALAGFPEIGVVSNAKDERGKPIGIANSGRNWHTDVQFDRTPPDATFLVSRELPEEGGDTWYASMTMAYAALDAGLRRRIDGMRVIHSRVRSWPILFPDRPPLPQSEAEKYPDVSHPLVRTHPVTGKQALYMGGNMAMGIEGLDDGEAGTLIRTLRDFATGEAFTYAHRWRHGDAVLWDNRSMMHRATPYDDGRYRRVMHRTSFGPAAPVHKGAPPTP